MVLKDKYGKQTEERYMSGGSSAAKAGNKKAPKGKPGKRRKRGRK